MNVNKVTELLLALIRTPALPGALFAPLDALRPLPTRLRGYWLTGAMGSTERCTDAKWRFMDTFWLKARLHTGHGNGRSPAWIVRCFFRLYLW